MSDTPTDSPYKTQGGGLFDIPPHMQWLFDAINTPSWERQNYITYCEGTMEHDNDYPEPDEQGKPERARGGVIDPDRVYLIPVSSPDDFIIVGNGITAEQFFLGVDWGVGVPMMTVNQSVAESFKMPEYWHLKRSMLLSDELHRMFDEMEREAEYQRKMRHINWFMYEGRIQVRYRYGQMIWRKIGRLFLYPFRLIWDTIKELDK